MTIAPWTIPPDYLGAMKAGAGIGLERARIDTGSAEAADRLRLAYTQLAAQEDRASEMAALKQAHASEALRHQSDLLSFQREKSSQLDDYRSNRLEQFGTEEQRKQSALNELIGYRNNRLEQIDTGQSESARHNQVTESISADKAKAMISRGEATPITYPEFPGMTFIRQPSGAILKVQSAERSPTVSLDSGGAFKGATGSINNPQMKALMGTNALPGQVGSPSDATQSASSEIDNPFKDATPEAISAGQSLMSPQRVSFPFTVPQGTKSGKRVRVTGPDGQTGTIQDGDDLPDGWTMTE